MEYNAHSSPPAKIWRIVLLLAISLATFMALTMPLASRSTEIAVQLGSVAQQDILAPRSLQYVSDTLTLNAQQAAAQAVAPVYASAAPSIARQQIELLRATLQYISIVRDDPHATPQQKYSDLMALKEVRLQENTPEKLLALSQNRWEILQAESLSVLEQVMRNTIRENDLSTIRRNIPSLVSLSLTEEQSQLVAELVSSFVIPNSLYSQELTEAARISARQAVQPVTQTFIEGEIIIQRGQVISATEIEALHAFNLLEAQKNWYDHLGSGALVLVISGFAAMYFANRKPVLMYDRRSLLVIAISFLLFLFLARITIPNRTVIPYLYPLAAYGLLMTVLFGREVGLVLSLTLAPVAAYNLGNAFDLTFYYLFTSLFGALTLGRAQRISAFLLSGIAIAIAGAATILAFKIPATNIDLVGIATLTLAAIFNGIASASITMMLQYGMAQFIGLTTPLHLLEISRPDFHLLQFFLRNAPGTYQHSLQVSNLAEQAAERIGADALLTRVGALYHDIGKAMNPSFFIENQIAGQIDTHDHLDPQAVSAAIVRHVTDGVVLARKHRLPKRIHDFILEHHGTFITRYQYQQAVLRAYGDESQLDKDLFRYPGPTPRSKETALLMFADMVEARTRADQPSSEEALHELIRNTILTAQNSGQLDNAPLTLRDISLVINSFMETLRNTYHPRIQYPPADTSQSDIPTIPTKIHDIS